MKKGEYVIKGFLNAGYNIARTDTRVYLIKPGRAVLELVYSKQGLAYIMQGKCVLWKA